MQKETSSFKSFYKQNDELWRDYREIYYCFYGNSPKHVSSLQYRYDHLIENDQYGNDHLVENDQYGQSINN